MNATTRGNQDGLERMLRLAPVVAVVVIDDREHAVPLARALVAGGIPAIEVTLRTPVAIAAIEAIGKAVPEAVVGAGTVLSAEELHAAESAGARFAVSPGSTPALLDAAAASSVPLLPGAASASEAMALRERGYRLQKFFPAEAAGGAAFLRALGGPLPDIRFCPTGGIRESNAGNYLALDNVICVGGSWLSPAQLMHEGGWQQITALAQAASRLSAG